MSTRRTFKCKFSDRVTSDNRDGVIQSLINQFEGLYADPEVTLDGDTFSITLTISDSLPPTLVRDKLALNYFIDRVTTGDSIKRIKVMRMPKATQEVIGNGEGQLDGIARDTGVNEILVNDDGHQQSQMEYKIDMGDRPDGPPVKKRNTVGLMGLGMSRGGSSWIKQADPGSLRNEGQAFTREPDDVMGPEDLDSMATDVTKLPASFAHFMGTEHPVPQNIIETYEHIQDHHPEIVSHIEGSMPWVQFMSLIRRNAKDPKFAQMARNVTEGHLTDDHENGAMAGNHPHIHSDRLNVSVPDSLPSSFAMRYATENDAGGSQFGQPFDKKTVMDSVDRAPQQTRGPRVNVFENGTSPQRATGGPIPFNSWLSETEATMPKSQDTKAPLDFTASLKGTDDENIDSALELPEATQGGTVLGLEGWFSASLHFAYDEGDTDNDGTYDYSEGYSDNDDGEDDE